MIKVIATFDRKPGMSREDFARYYFENHPALLWSLLPEEVGVGLVRYVQNHAVDLGGSSPHDCVTELGFVDREALRRWNDWYFGPDAAALRADEENFMDLAGRTIVVTEERTPARPS